LGTTFRADVELDPGSSLDWYEIQLAPRAGPNDPVWDDPIWRFRSDMPHIASIGGSPPFEGVRIRSARPSFRLRVAEPVDRVRWELRQDGEVVEKGRGAEGISRDGRSIKFTPAKRLRRSGELAKPRGDVLYPPFDSHLAGLPRSAETRIRYSALTGDHHNDPFNRFAVDFNFGSMAANLGEWVLAAAGGRVEEVDKLLDGKVRIVHNQFDPPIETLYAHMDPILDAIKVGEHVDPLQRIGRIDSKHHSMQISPHLHHQHLRNGDGVPMRLLIGDKMTEIPVSKRAPVVDETWEKLVSGWDRPRGLARARLTARVRRASDGRWSAANRLRFVVAPRGADVPPAPVTLGPADAPAGSDIAYAFDGPDVEPGKYSLRYRVHGSSGAQSDWAHDDSVVVRPGLA
jgi:hypothetical protein